MQEISRKKVGVIGAGPSGLVTVKELLEAGHEVVCFEKAPGLGGVYRYDEKASGTYASMQLTSSAMITCFSDFPPPKKAPAHLKHDAYRQYLEEYADHFKVIDCIYFGCEVKEARQSEDEKWHLKVLDLKKDSMKNEVVDALVVCSGAHQAPAFPSYLRQHRFEGEIWHSSDYKHPDVFKDKRVLIVGAGESAADITDEVSKVSAECMVSVGRGTLIIPRKIFASPNDYYTNRLFYMLPTWFVRKLDNKLQMHRIALMVMSLFSIFFISAGVERFIRWMIQQSAVAELLFYLGCFVLTLYAVFYLLKFTLCDLSPGVLRIMLMKLSDLSSGHAGQFATKSTGMARAVAQGRCRIVSGIKEFQKNKIIFSDGEMGKVDAAIFCTGYRIYFPFLENKEMDFRQLYKNCFDSSIGKTLCFIGFARPTIGAMPPIAEMQARWFCSVLNGDTFLPERKEMEEKIARDASRHKMCFPAVTDRLTGLVEYTVYMDELAATIGCKPRFKDLWYRPRLLFHIYANPFAAAQYRLKGPLPKRKIAQKMMTQIPLEPFWTLYSFGLAVVVSICWVLAKLGFSDFKPNLSLGLSEKAE